MTKYVDAKKNELYSIFDEEDIKKDVLAFAIDGITEDNVFLNFEQNATANDIEKQKANDVNINISRPHYSRLEVPEYTREYIYENKVPVGVKNRYVRFCVMFANIDIWNYTERSSTTTGTNDQLQKHREIFCKKIKDILYNKLIFSHYFIDLEDENETDLDDGTNLKQNHYILKIRKNVLIVVDEMVDVVDVKKYPKVDNIFFNI